MKIRTCRRVLPLTLAAAAGLLAVPTAGFAQAFSWNTAVTGNWNVGANWNPVGVPNGAANTATLGLVGAYTVNQNIAVTLGGLTISNTAATLNVLDTNSLFLSGAATPNAGTIVVNSGAGSSGAYVRFDAVSSTLGSNGGLARLNASSGNVNTAYMQANGGPVDNVAGHTISGNGRLAGAWVNHGLISANVSGLTLQMDSGARTNNNIIQAVGGGTLVMSGSTTTQASGGRIVAQGGTVTLSSCTTSGGTVEQLAGGTVLYVGANTFTNVQPIGPLTLPDSTSLFYTTATLNHDSTMTINGAAGTGGAYVRFDAGATSFGGTGTTLLNASSTNINTAYMQANGGPVTHAAGHTIHGTGHLSGPWINNGLISADVSGLTLQMDSGARTNNNIIQAVGGGTLLLNGNTTTQGASGRIVAQGGTVALSSCTTSGGTVEQLAGGTVLYVGANTFTNVQPIGPLTLPDSTSLFYTTATLNHDSTMTINGTAGTGGAYLRFDAAATTFGGTGSTLLNANSANVNTAYMAANGGPVTQAASHTIHGTGRLISAWVNNGLISADASGKTLQMDSGARTNNNIIQAVGGGTLLLNGNTTTQGASGRIVAQGGTVALSSCTTSGGTVEQLAGGTVLYVGANTFTNVQPIGPLTLPDSTSLFYTTGTLNYDSTMTINGAAGTGGAYVRFDAVATSFGGTGTTLLNANSGNINTAYLQANGGPVNHGPNRTISGYGILYGNQTIQGVISPGVAPGAIGTISAASGTLTLTSSSIVNIELGGAAAGQFDTIVGGSSKVLAGTLHVSLVNAYAPAGTSFFDIITGGAVTGQFSTVTLPTVGAFGPAHVIYLPDRVRIVMCYANCDGSTASPALTANDFQCFLNAFAAGDPYANCDGSTANPLLTANDFQCFLNKYSVGCN